MLQAGDTHSHVKTIISFLIFLLAAAIFFIFYTNKDHILVPGTAQLFMTLAIIGMGLLIGLLFLVSNSDTRGSSKVKVARAHKTVKAGRSTKKKRK